MKELTKKVIQEVCSGYLFSVILMDGYEFKVQVDMTGNVVSADYGNSNGWCARTSGDEDFEEAVRIAMNGILEKNITEFALMRDHLNDKWKNVAEDIRKAMLSKWDF